MFRDNFIFSKIFQPKIWTCQIWKNFFEKNRNRSKPLESINFCFESDIMVLKNDFILSKFSSQKFEIIKFGKKFFCLKSTEKVMFEYSRNLIYTEKIVLTHVSFEPKFKIAQNRLNRLIFARKVVSGCLETMSFFRNFFQPKIWTGQIWKNFFASNRPEK